MQKPTSQHRTFAPIQPHSTGWRPIPETNEEHLQQRWIRAKSRSEGSSYNFKMKTNQAYSVDELPALDDVNEPSNDNHFASCAQVPSVTYARLNEQAMLHNPPTRHNTFATTLFWLRSVLSGAENWDQHSSRYVFFWRGAFFWRVTDRNIATDRDIVTDRNIITDRNIATDWNVKDNTILSGSLFV